MSGGMIAPYPHRQCACGNQIHVGGVYLCRECMERERSEQLDTESGVGAKDCRAMLIAPPQIGDEVVLVSGSPVMTVEWVSTDVKYEEHPELLGGIRVAVVWFNEVTGTLARDTVPLASLRAAPGLQE